MQNWKLPKGKRKSGPVLVIPDIHCPFTKQEYLDFLIEVAESVQPEIIVQIGDFIDSNSVSNYDLNPDGMSFTEEFDKVREWIDKYSEAFPYMIQLVGNHTSRIYKKAKKYGIPKSFIRPLEDVLGFPPGWELVKEVIINNVRYIHGEGYGGNTPGLTAAMATNMSTVVGDKHNCGGIWYYKTLVDKQIFGASTGALVDEDSYAFDYKALYKKKDIKGCVVVYDETYAQFIPYIERK